MTRYLLLIFCFFTFSVAGQSQSNIDVLHYKFTIELNDDNDTIYGRADITVKFLESSNRLEFNLVHSRKILCLCLRDTPNCKQECNH